VFGYNEHWKEKHLSAKTFLAIGVFASLVTGMMTYSWLATPAAGVGNVAAASIGAVCGALLTLFFFWSGAGGFDRYVVDGLVNGVAYLSGFFGAVFRKTQTGRVQSYIVFVIAGVMILFFIFFR
jgi:hypothetical protein